MKTTARILPALAALAIFASRFEAQDWHWRRVGWEGNWVADTASPHDSSHIVYASLDYRWPFEDEGVHKSYDGGSTWLFLENSHNPRSARLTIDPKDPATVYCGGVATIPETDAYARRSRDAGTSWEMITGPVDLIVASPWRDGVLLATSNINGGWGLWRSTDDGETWTAVSGCETPGMTDKVIFHHEDSLVVFAGYVGSGRSQGLARSLDEGEAWDVVLEGVINSFDQDPANGAHLVAVEGYDDYAGEPAYFAESWDHGVTWELWPLPEPILGARELVFDRFDSQILYMADFCFESLGVYRSQDGGHTWEPMNNGFDPLPGRCRPCPRESPPGELFAATRDGLWLWSNGQSGEYRPDPVNATIRIIEVAPCPFRDRMAIRYIVDNDNTGNVDVYSLDGVLVAVLAGGALQRGMREIAWNGRTRSGVLVAPGAYVIRIRAGEDAAALKVVRLE